jgi:TatD DNase family protein
MSIDSHCHLQDPKFAKDRLEVIERAKKAGVEAFITIGCDIETTKDAHHIASIHPEVFFTAGFHPHEAKKADQEALAALKILAQKHKCVAIGECGLDYYYEHSPKNTQNDVFAHQLDLAKELNLPVVIHLRDAFSDCQSLLKQAGLADQSVVIHCFSGSLSEAKAFLDMGLLISLSGILTFKKAGELPEVAKAIPLDRLLIETDAPYLAPIPHRGQRNEPAFIKLILEKIAEIRAEPTDQIDKILTENTKRFFKM